MADKFESVESVCGKTTIWGIPLADLTEAQCREALRMMVYSHYIDRQTISSAGNMLSLIMSRKLV